MDDLNVSPHYRWQCELFGSGDAIVLKRVTAPNFFWRWMQFIILGNRWSKIKQHELEG